MSNNLRVPPYELVGGGARGRLEQDYVYSTSVWGHVVERFKSPYVQLLTGGTLTLRSGYTWDFGTFAVDDPAMTAASLVHDGLYQLIREGHIPKKWRKQADKELREALKRGGVGWFRRRYVYMAVRLAGWYALRNGEPYKH